MAASKLTPELRELVFARVAGGLSYQDAANWLKSAHGVSITKQAVGEIVRRRKGEVSDVSKAIARDHIARTLPAELVAADDKHAQSARLLDLAASMAEQDPTAATFEMYAKASQAFLKFETMRRETLGLNQPDDSFVDGLMSLTGLALDAEEEAARAAMFDDGSDDGSGGGEKA